MHQYLYGPWLDTFQGCFLFEICFVCSFLSQVVYTLAKRDVRVLSCLQQSQYINRLIPTSALASSLFLHQLNHITEQSSNMPATYGVHHPSHDLSFLAIYFLLHSSFRQPNHITSIPSTCLASIVPVIHQWLVCSCCLFLHFIYLHLSFRQCNHITSIPSWYLPYLSPSRQPNHILLPSSTLWGLFLLLCCHLIFIFPRCILWLG